MNKVILMGRLTRDPEVRYSQGESATAIAGIHWRLTEDSTATTTRIQQILSDALHSAEARNSQRSISVKVRRSL